MICHQLAESVEEAGEHQNMHAETRALVRSPLPFPFSVFASLHVEPGRCRVRIRSTPDDAPCLVGIRWKG